MCGWVTVLRGRWLNGLPFCHLQNQMSPPQHTSFGPDLPNIRLPGTCQKCPMSDCPELLPGSVQEERRRPRVREAEQLVTSCPPPTGQGWTQDCFLPGTVSTQHRLLNTV